MATLKMACLSIMAHVYLFGMGNKHSMPAMPNPTENEMTDMHYLPLPVPSLYISLTEEEQFYLLMHCGVAGLEKIHAIPYTGIKGISPKDNIQLGGHIMGGGASRKTLAINAQKTTMTKARQGSCAYESHQRFLFIGNWLLMEREGHSMRL